MDEHGIRVGNRAGKPHTRAGNLRTRGTGNPHTPAS